MFAEPRAEEPTGFRVLPLAPLKVAGEAGCLVPCRSRQARRSTSTSVELVALPPERRAGHLTACAEVAGMGVAEETAAAAGAAAPRTFAGSGRRSQIALS